MRPKWQVVNSYNDKIYQVLRTSKHQKGVSYKSLAIHKYKRINLDSRQSKFFTYNLNDCYLLLSVINREKNISYHLNIWSSNQFLRKKVHLFSSVIKISSHHS